MDDLLFLLSIAVLLFCAFKAGEMYGYWNFYKAIAEFLETKGLDLKKELEKEIDKEDAPESKTPKVYKLETHEENDMLYLYNRDTNSFICQAPTIEELAKLAKDYKNITAASVLHGKKVFMFMDGNAKEFT